VIVDIVGWTITGLLTSVAAPGLLLLVVRTVPWDRAAAPAAVVFPGFIVLHGVIAYVLTWHPSAAVWLALHVLLLAGALLFWLPIFGQGRRISDPLRVLYLFLAMPPLDLAGVVVIVLGDHAGGLAMIIAMLPAALITLFVTWRWIVTEDADEDVLVRR
jgi:hypothetical protein